MVTTSSFSCVICVGSDGRCSEDAPALSIDVVLGCIRLALKDELQDPF